MKRNREVAAKFIIIPSVSFSWLAGWLTGCRLLVLVFGFEFGFEFEFEFGFGFKLVLG